MREVVTINRMAELVKLVNFHDTHEWELPVSLSYASINYLGGMLSSKYQILLFFTSLQSPDLQVFPKVSLR